MQYGNISIYKVQLHCRVPDLGCPPALGSSSSALRAASSFLRGALLPLGSASPLLRAAPPPGPVVRHHASPRSEAVPDTRVSGSGQRVADVARGLHPLQVAVGPRGAAEPLSSGRRAPLRRVHPALAVAPLGERADGAAARRRHAAGAVADAAEGARAAGQQGAVTGQGGEEGEGEGPLTLEDALRGAEAGRGGGGGQFVAAGYGVRRRRRPALLLDGLNLAPLQLKHFFQVSLQRAHGLGPRGPTALCVVEDRQLTEAPGVERRREEVWEVQTTVGVSSGSGGARRVVLVLDDLRPQLELWRNPTTRRRGKSLRLREVGVTVPLLMATRAPHLWALGRRLLRIRTGTRQAVAGKGRCVSTPSQTPVLLFPEAAVMSSRPHLQLHPVLGGGQWAGLWL
ncbi:hypothetical protein EYF80_010057 [Liparis tanakae]|uniref:Uncharacterized protein n=1 Tax=Liparis tanakae TaxID=230148 RepID=A0A4Z2IR71_9TELE|nr:hypothetical protein EYF80_010057 [Liparis tanakae]